MLGLGMLSFQMGMMKPTKILGSSLWKRGFFTESHVPPVDEFKNTMSTVGSQGMFKLRHSFTTLATAILTLS